MFRASQICRSYIKKIKLTERGKEILLLLDHEEYILQDTDEEAKELLFLTIEGLIGSKTQIASQYPIVYLKPKGKAYLLSNPNLDNPSIWDDKKFKISTLLSIIIILLSIISLVLQLK